MNILPVGNGILFKSRLKKLYKQGKINIEYDIYGNKLTKKNVTDEHIKCRCYGGTSDLSNIALATKEANWARGCKPIEEFLTYGQLRQYLLQFKDVKLPNFDGNEYIAGIRKTIKELIGDA